MQLGRHNYVIESLGVGELLYRRKRTMAPGSPPVSPRSGVLNLSTLNKLPLNQPDRQPDRHDQLNPPARHPVLEVSGFSLKFSRAAHVPNLVEDVSFSVNAGETLCIVGESGCGKSVTSLALMGLLPSPPANIVAGKAMFDDRDLFKLSERELADIRGNRMSMIFQEPMTSLNPAFTVEIGRASCRERV